MLVRRRVVLQLVAFVCQPCGKAFPRPSKFERHLGTKRHQRFAQRLQIHSISAAHGTGEAQTEQNIEELMQQMCEMESPSYETALTLPVELNSGVSY